MSIPHFTMDTVRRTLKSSCPFIVFAFVNSTKGTLNGSKILQLWVYTDRQTDYLTAIARVLGTLETIAPGVDCDLAILNSVDAHTRANSLTRTCLFVREGSESIYWKFIERVGQEKQTGRLHPKLWRIEKRLEEGS